MFARINEVYENVYRTLSQHKLIRISDFPNKRIENKLSLWVKQIEFCFKLNDFKVILYLNVNLHFNSI